MSHTKTIDSESNPTFKTLAKLLEAQGLKHSDSYLVFGEKFVLETLKNAPDSVMGLIASVKHPLDSFSKLTNIPRYQLKDSLFKTLDVVGSQSPLLLVKKAELMSFDSFKGSYAVYLSLQNPENLGAALRSTVGFGINDIILSPESASPYLPKSVRAAGPIYHHLTFYKGPQPLALAQSPWPLVTMSMEGEKLQSFKFPSKFILVIGQEGQGLPDALRQPQKNIHCLRIPMTDAIESLNAQTSLAIALYQWRTYST
jgi:tRNA G18 (ribose-2'-O)-methylase SpoU